MDKYTASKLFVGRRNGLLLFQAHEDLMKQSVRLRAEIHDEAFGLIGISGIFFR
jgi:hypothetical protein